MSEEDIATQACIHENLAVASTYDLVNIMYQIEQKMTDKTAEEKLGFLTNAVTGVIYASSEVMGIESWIVQDGEKSIKVTPVATQIPNKQQVN